MDMLCLRRWGWFTAERKRLQNGEGHSLPAPRATQIPRLKYGWLRPGFGHTGERHCLLDGEGHGLLSPIRRPSLANRRVVLRGPAPRAKPVGAPPHPWGFLARPGPGSEVTQIPSRVKTVFHGNYPPSVFRSHSHVQSRDLGMSMSGPQHAEPDALQLALCAHLLIRLQMRIGATRPSLLVSLLMSEFTKHGNCPKGPFLGQD